MFGIFAKLSSKTLEYWIARARKEKVFIVAEAICEPVVRIVEGIPFCGYELCRVFRVRRKNEEAVIKKPSAFGYFDDTDKMIEKNVRIANFKYARDIKKLEKAGISVSVKNWFSADIVYAIVGRKR